MTLPPEWDALVRWINIAMANAEAHRSTAELAAISTLIVGDGTAEEILAKLRARLNTRTTGDVKGA